MNCPYDAVALHPRRLESDVDVEICPVCSGTWLSEGELRALQEAHSHDRANPEPEPVRAAFEMAAQELREPGPCPICDDTLLRQEYAYTSQVLIDVCANGHGMWLDAGELSRLEQFFVRQRAATPEPASLRQLWARVISALKGDAPIGG